MTPNKMYELSDNVINIAKNILYLRHSEDCPTSDEINSLVDEIIAYFNINCLSDDYIIYIRRRLKMRFGLSVNEI